MNWWDVCGKELLENLMFDVFFFELIYRNDVYSY